MRSATCSTDRFIVIRSRKTRVLAILCLLLFVQIETILPPARGESAVVDPSPVVTGISSICAIGAPGPLWALSDTVIPVAAGDEDTTPVPSVVVMASGLGSGRVIALGHEGFLTNDALGLFDNEKFGNNVVDWLDKLNRREILATTGHREWYGGGNFDRFKSELEDRGYVVDRFSGTLTESVLSDIGVVLVGTAWGAFLESEIDALKGFVSGGGGLLLTGLGWSWEPYNTGFTLDDYPMNKIGEIFGIRWIDGGISDPTNSYEGQPIFHTFYPDVELQTIYRAFSYIEETTDAHPSDLPSLLQRDGSVRMEYANAHLLLATATADLSQSSTQRQEIYDFYNDLINSYPQYFQKNIVYDTASESAMAWIRERIYRSLIDAMPLTVARKNEISATIGLTGRYSDIWNDFSVMLLDNTCLSDRQKEFIYRYLSLVPKDLHNLRSISVTDFLGSTSRSIDLWRSGGAVNIFGLDIGRYSENSFPDDVPPGIVDVFCIVVAHEVNHVVDAFYVRDNASLASRRDALIAAAGRDKMNYLRSMAQEFFFADAPQEFFACIANQWFTDSKKTIELGLARFDKGYRQPINQALFFADVYSLEGSSTYFYTIDRDGNIAREAVPLTRDTDGRITSLQFDDLVYSFTLDVDGDVVDYVVATAPKVTPTLTVTTTKVGTTTETVSQFITVLSTLEATTTRTVGFTYTTSTVRTALTTVTESVTKTVPDQRMLDAQFVLPFAAILVLAVLGGLLLGRRWIK